MLTDDNEAIIKENKMAELWMQVYDFTQNPLHGAKRIEGHFGGQDYKLVIEEAKLEGLPGSGDVVAFLFGAKPRAVQRDLADEPLAVRFIEFATAMATSSAS